MGWDELGHDFILYQTPPLPLPQGKGVCVDRKVLGTLDRSWTCTMYAGSVPRNTPRWVIGSSPTRNP
jgi:hypothetical protein